jgi:nicotinate phosphoribosyltransferase
MAYKLVEYAGRPRMKLSSRKATYPGRKQVFRFFEGGSMVRDLVGRHDEAFDGEPLLLPMMRGGVRLPAGQADLEAARAHAQHELRRLPESLRSLAPVEVPYRVDVSSTLQADREALLRALAVSRL